MILFTTDFTVSSMLFEIFLSMISFIVVTFESLHLFRFSFRFVWWLIFAPKFMHRKSLIGLQCLVTNKTYKLIGCLFWYNIYQFTMMTDLIFLVKPKLIKDICFFLLVLQYQYVLSCLKKTHSKLFRNNNIKNSNVYNLHNLQMTFIIWIHSFFFIRTIL